MTTQSSTVNTAHVRPIPFLVLTIAMTSVTYGFGRYAFGLFLPSLRAEFTASTTQLGAIASANAATYLVSTVLASTFAVYVPPTIMMVGACLVTVAGLLVAGLSASIGNIALGIIIAGFGGGILSPALFEAIEAWLPEDWKVKAVASVSAGATPGMIVTAVAGYAAADTWRIAWIAMAVVGAVILSASFLLLPKTSITRDLDGPKLPLTPSLFLQAANLRLYLSLLAYGGLFSVYLIFSVDRLNTLGYITPPQDKLFWAFLGIAGLPAMLNGLVISHMGLSWFLRAVYLGCGLSYGLLVIAPDRMLVVLLSAILFGYTSIGIGSGLLVWSIRIFKDRPSIGSGVVFFLFSAMSIVSPTLSSLVMPILGSSGLFSLLAIVSGLVALSLSKEALR